ncbi:MAG: hypothetical protein FWE03_06690 [Firmicutes bacterium]|nr:hypothetical protein [Bacillota bacterium]
MSILTREQQEILAKELQKILNDDLDKELFEVKYDHCGAHSVYYKIDNNKRSWFEFGLQPNWFQTQSDYEKNGDEWNISDRTRNIDYSDFENENFMNKIKYLASEYGFLVNERRIEKKNLRNKSLQSEFIKFVQLVNQIEDIKKGENI